MNQVELQAKLERLPRRSMVAFAARCARRVLPLYESHGKPDPAVRRAIDVADRWAAGESKNAVDAADNAAWAADAVENNDAATWAARTANAAVWTADVVDTAVWAAKAAAGAAKTARGDVDLAEAVVADLDRFLALNLGRPGELGPLVDSDESGPLGPLWPKEEPEWHRKAVALAKTKAAPSEV